MNKILNFITLFLAVAASVSVVSCLDDDTIATSPQCVIASFSVDDISTSITTKKSDGEDTTYTRVIDGDEVYFNIDQVNNRISSVDSLPSWTDLSRVVPTVSYAGYIYCQQHDDSLFYSFTSGSDSVDFTQPVRFMLVSTDGHDSRIYTAQIFLSQQDADSLYWTQLSNTQLPAMGEHRLLSFGGKLFAFCDTNGGCAVCVGTPTSGNAIAWSGLTEIEGAATPESQTVCTFQDAFLALDATGHLLRSADGYSWSQVGESTYSSLLCGDNNWVYATNDTALIASNDLESWQVAGDAELALLPNAPVQSATYTTNTNPELDHVVMLGLSAQDAENAVAWYKVSSSDPELDQSWAYIRITDDNSYAMPSLDGLRMVRYADALYAFGSPYDTFYRSKDNGVTWHPLSSSALPPTSLRGDDSAKASLAVLNGYIWITTGDGRMWRGSMR